MTSAPTGSDADRAHASRQVRVGLKWLPLARGLRFLTTVMLGRFIVPGQFGLIDASMAIIVILYIFRDSGFGQAFIQRQSKDGEDERLAADTTFYFTLSINVSIFATAFLAAPWLASHFKTDDGLATADLANVLRAMSALFVIDGLATAPGLVLQKRLEFGKTAVAEVLGTLIFAVTAGTAVLLGHGVWSIVIAHVLSRSVEMTLLYAVSGWRPRLRFSRRVLRELFVFGKWMWGFSALSAVGGSIDRLLIGTLSGLTDLGLYGRALNVCNMPSRQLAFVVNRIAFPALSRMQDDLDAMRRSFSKALSHVAILAMPMGFGLVAVAEEFVATVFRAEYGPAAGIVEVLAFYGMALATSSVAGPVLQAIGKPKILLYSSIVHHALLFPLVGTLWVYGPVGVAYGVLIPMLVSTAITYGLVMKYLSLRFFQAAEPALRAGLCAALMLGTVEIFQSAVAPLAASVDREFQVTADTTLSLWMLVSLLASAMVGVIAYAAYSFLLNRAHATQFVVTVREVLGARSRPR